MVAHGGEGRRVVGLDGGGGGEGAEVRVAVARRVTGVADVEASVVDRVAVLKIDIEIFEKIICPTARCG